MITRSCCVILTRSLSDFFNIDSAVRGKRPFGSQKNAKKKKLRKQRLVNAICKSDTIRNDTKNDCGNVDLLMDETRNN